MKNLYYRNIKERQESAKLNTRNLIPHYLSNNKDDEDRPYMSLSQFGSYEHVIEQLNRRKGPQTKMLPVRSTTSKDS